MRDFKYSKEQVQIKYDIDYNQYLMIKKNVSKCINKQNKEFDIFIE